MSKIKSNAKLNYIYSVAYSILTTLLPLVTAPYISRVIGANGLGIYNYNYTIVMYCMLFAMLGVGYYGNRAIAKVRDNENERNEVFSEIYSLQLLTAGIVATVYILYVLIVVKENRLIAGIMMLYVLAPSITVNWFFYGLEMFKITVTRNFVVKMITVSLIFIFVKNSGDLWKYTLILAMGTFISEGYLIIYVHKYVRYKRPTFENILKHLKPNVILFIPVFAVSIYRSMDKLMLKWIVDYEEVGFYSNSEKIINICIAFISALGQVMLPKMTNLLANGNSEQFNVLTRKSLKFSSFLSIAMFYGLLGVSRDFVPLFYGPGYEPCIPLLELLSVNLMFLAWGSVLRSEFLVPKEQDSIFIKSVLWGVVVNLLLNFLLIPRLKAIGATIGTISAEVFSLIFILVGIRKEFDVRRVIKDALPYYVIGAIMFVSVRLVERLNLAPTYLLLSEIITGIVVYLVLSLIYWHITKDEMEATVRGVLRKIGIK